MESAYSRLGKYLDRVGQRQLTLTFRQLEAVLGRPLPPTARLRPAWWANASDARDHNHHAWYGWLSVGWEACPDVRRGTVTFARRPTPEAAAAPAPASPAAADSAPVDPDDGGTWAAARRLARLAARA